MFSMEVLVRFISILYVDFVWDVHLDPYIFSKGDQERFQHLRTTPEPILNHFGTSLTPSQDKSENRL